MSSYSSPVHGPWAQPSTAARASSIEESEAGAEWDGRAGYEHEHTPAPAILHQASSARSPITLPHTPSASPSLACLPRYPFLGAHAQSLRGGALANMHGVTSAGEPPEHETGQRRTPETLRQQAGAEQQQQQQSEGAQGADVGAVHTPPARAQAGEQPARMVPDTTLRAFKFSVDCALKAMQQQQAGQDRHWAQEVARLDQVRARTRMHDDAHLSSLLLGAFLSLDASCAQQVLEHSACTELPQHALEFCTSLVQSTPSPFCRLGQAPLLA